VRSVLPCVLEREQLLEVCRHGAAGATTTGRNRQDRRRIRADPRDIIFGCAGLKVRLPVHTKTKFTCHQPEPSQTPLTAQTHHFLLPKNVCVKKRGKCVRREKGGFQILQHNIPSAT
jgi:hypothetical protein